MSSIAEFLDDDEPAVCINCGGEPEEERRLEGWRMAELGPECPACRAAAELVEKREREAGVADLSSSDLKRLSAAATKAGKPLA